MVMRMKKRNKDSEEKKRQILEDSKWKPISKQPVLSSGILLRDISYGRIEQTNNRYGYPGGWEAQMKDMSNPPDILYEGATIWRNGPIIDIWAHKKLYRNNSTIMQRRKSWPIYNDRFEDMSHLLDKVKTSSIRKITKKQ